MRIGYTHGRFQPLHKGHLPIFLYILERYDELWVGISNPLRRLPHNFESYDNDLKESIKKARKKEKNIFSYLEREKMILSTLSREGIDIRRVKVLPHFGYYEEDNWSDFIPDKEKTTVVIHSKDIHHNKKVNFYKKHGWKTEKIPLLVEDYSGTLFHGEYPGGEWREMVPEEVKKIIENK